MLLRDFLVLDSMLPAKRDYLTGQRLVVEKPEVEQKVAPRVRVLAEVWSSSFELGLCMLAHFALPGPVESIWKPAVCQSLWAVVEEMVTGTTCGQEFRCVIRCERQSARAVAALEVDRVQNETEMGAEASRVDHLPLTSLPHL